MGLDFVELTMRVKESFGVDVEPEDFRLDSDAPSGKQNLRTTVGDLLEVILRKRQSLARREGDVGLRELAVADVRRALAEVLERPVDAIAPHGQLESLVDKHRRRAIWRRLARRLRKRLPRLELEYVSERAVWWTICLLLTAATAAAGIWWISDDPGGSVSRWLAFIMISAAASLPGALGAAAFVSLPWWLRRRLPKHVASVEDLGAAVLGLNRDRYVHEHGDRDDDVWPSLRILVADVLDVPVERVTLDADLIRDLGCS